MEKVTCQKIQLSEINPDPVFCTRFEPASIPEDLKASIARQGVLMPLLVSHSPRPNILAGYRRYAALRALGVTQLTVLRMNEPLQPKESFLAAVISNWKGQWTEIDRVFCIGRAFSEFGFECLEASEVLLPALGLEPRKHVFEEYLETSQLEKPLLEAMSNEQLPYRGARLLVKLSAEDQGDFAKHVVANAALTSQELVKFADGLRTLMRQSCKGLQETLQEMGAQAILEHSRWDRRTKGDKLCQRMRECVNPALTQKEKQFSAALKQAGDLPAEFRIEAPPFFEEQGYQLRAKLKSPSDLARYRKLLETHSEWLNSLFDSVL